MTTLAFNIEANRAFDNFDELVAAINDWMDREDLTGVAPQMVAMTEDEIRLAIEPYFLEKSTSLTTDADGFVALPSDAKRVARVMLGDRVLNNWAQNATNYENTGSTVRGYTMESGGIRVWPNGAETLRVLYQPKLERLTEGTPTNLLLDEFPSLYFFGAMTFAEGYVANDARAANFRGLFGNMLARVAQYYMKQGRAGPLIPRMQCVP